MICSKTYNATALEKELEHELGSMADHYYGLVNFGNTCYCSSVLQALFFCSPFRSKILQYRQETKNNKKETMLACLADLFYAIKSQKRKVGSYQPKRFVARLKRENELFDNFNQHDAHEFLNYLLNSLADTLQAERVQPSQEKWRKGKDVSPAIDNNSSSRQEGNTWVHELFQGTLTNEVRCLNCETISSKDENFLDLSVEIQPNTSITYCLGGFLGTETLSAEHKYYCEVCLSKQEAQKRMRIKKMPEILALHLKRFKYQEHLNRNTKLNHRVVFPFEFRPGNTTEDSHNSDRLFDLVAVVIHSGAVPHKGHYLTCVKSCGRWFLFDDDCVEKIDVHNVEEFFGVVQETPQRANETAYILFYQARD